MEVLEQQQQQQPPPALHHSGSPVSGELSSLDPASTTTESSRIRNGGLRLSAAQARSKVSRGLLEAFPAGPPPPPSMPPPPQPSNLFLGIVESQAGGGQGSMGGILALPVLAQEPQTQPPPQRTLAVPATMPPEPAAVVGKGTGAATLVGQQQQVRPPQSVAAAACVICKRPAEDGRPLLHFAPVPHDPSVMHSAPTVRTFTSHVHLHVFCGKTASILPHVNQPDLEILSKAGLKNKHGTGPEVNASLARTRSALLNQPNAKDKEFFLVREFEAHLSAVRGTSIGLLGLLPVASADPYGNWRGPHQQYLLEQQQQLELQQQQEEQQQQQEEGDADPASLEKQPQHDASDVTADNIKWLQNLADSSLALTSTTTTTAMNFEAPSLASATDPAADPDNPAVNDEENDKDDDGIDNLGNDGLEPSPSSMPLAAGLFQDSAVSTDAASASTTTMSDGAASIDKKRGSSSSPTSASETEWKIPRKRLASSTSSTSTPSRDGGGVHPSPSLLGSNNSHFLDPHPSYPFTAGPSYRNGGTISTLSPHTPNVQPLYHSMLISSASSALDSSMLTMGNGAESGAAAWSRIILSGGAPGTPSSRGPGAPAPVPRIQCGCGGSHLPPDTSKGMLSWRNHVMTKRHQNWLRSHGLVGAV